MGWAATTGWGSSPSARPSQAKEASQTAWYQPDPARWFRYHLFLWSFSPSPPPFAAIHAPVTHGANPSPHPFSGSPVTVDRGILPVHDENSYMSALLWCRNLGKHLRWERLGAARPGFAPRALGVCCTEQPVTAVAGGRGGVLGLVLRVPRQITARRPATSAEQPCWTTRCAPRARAGCGRPR